MEGVSHFDRNVAAEILSPVLGGVSVAAGGLLFFEKRSCLPSLKKLKGGEILEKKVKEKTP